MIKKKFIFVVLVYKNTDVLISFFESIRCLEAKVVVVNSYFDQNSLKECKTIASDNNSDFIEIPNKGYGYGNNVGIQYALDHYLFDYLIVSNSDIVVTDLSDLANCTVNSCVIAPNTKLLNNKHQNPNISKNIYLHRHFLNKYYDNDEKLYNYFARVINGFYRIIYLFLAEVFNLDSIKIFSAHGSFVIFTNEAIKKIFPPFNDKMFLYNEELYLAYKCRLLKIPIFYRRNIRVTHLEGASSESVISISANKQSYSELKDWKKQNSIID